MPPCPDRFGAVVCFLERLFQVVPTKKRARSRRIFVRRRFEPTAIPPFYKFTANYTSFTKGRQAKQRFDLINTDDLKEMSELNKSQSDIIESFVVSHAQRRIEQVLATLGNTETLNKTTYVGRVWRNRVQFQQSSLEFFHTVFPQLVQELATHGLKARNDLKYHARFKFMAQVSITVLMAAATQHWEERRQIVTAVPVLQNRGGYTLYRLKQCTNK